MIARVRRRKRKKIQSHLQLQHNFGGFEVGVGMKRCEFFQRLTCDTIHV